MKSPQDRRKVRFPDLSPANQRQGDSCVNTNKESYLLISLDRRQRFLEPSCFFIRNMTDAWAFRKTVPCIEKKAIKKHGSRIKPWKKLPVKSSGIKSIAPARAGNTFRDSQSHWVGSASSRESNSYKLDVLCQINRLQQPTSSHPSLLNHRKTMWSRLTVSKPVPDTGL